MKSPYQNINHLLSVRKRLDDFRINKTAFFNEGDIAFVLLNKNNLSDYIQFKGMTLEKIASIGKDKKDPRGACAYMFMVDYYKTLSMIETTIANLKSSKWHFKNMEDSK